MFNSSCSSIESLYMRCKSSSYFFFVWKKESQINKCGVSKKWVHQQGNRNVFNRSVNRASYGPVMKLSNISLANVCKSAIIHIYQRTLHKKWHFLLRISLENVSKCSDSSWRRSGVFIVDFEHISNLVLVFLLLTLTMQIPAGSAFCNTNTNIYIKIMVVN